jgi:hypothetical protein
MQFEVGIDGVKIDIGREIDGLNVENWKRD